MNHKENQEHFAKCAEIVEEEARKTKERLWQLYGEDYTKIQDCLEETSLSKLDIRILTKRFDDLVWKR